MSNQVTIRRTRFENVSSGEKSMGFRGYDCHGQCYCNTMNEEEIALEGLEFLKLAVDSYMDDSLSYMIDYVVNNECGMYIDDDWFDWDEIKEIVKDH